AADRREAGPHGHPAGWARAIAVPRSATMDRVDTGTAAGGAAGPLRDRGAALPSRAVTGRLARPDRPPPAHARLDSHPWPTNHTGGAGGGRFGGLAGRRDRPGIVDDARDSCPRLWLSRPFDQSRWPHGARRLDAHGGNSADRIAIRAGLQNPSDSSRARWSIRDGLHPRRTSRVDQRRGINGTVRVSRRCAVTRALATQQPPD